MIVLVWAGTGLLLSLVAAWLITPSGGDDNETSHYEGTVHSGTVNLKPVTNWEARFKRRASFFFVSYMLVSAVVHANIPSVSTPNRYDRMLEAAQSDEKLTLPRKNYALAAAPFFDKYLCYKKTDNGPTPCPAVENLRRVAAQLGEPGDKAFEQLDYWLQYFWLPKTREIDGRIHRSGILMLSPDGTIEGILKKNTDMFGASYNTDLADAVTEFFASLRKIDSKKLQSALESDPIALRISRDTPGIGDSPRCWDYAVGSSKWTKAGCGQDVSESADAKPNK